MDKSDDYSELVIVRKRVKDNNGKPIGVPDTNPILDTRMYEIEYTDGHHQAISANLIAKNLFAQVNEEGKRRAIVNQIIDIRSNGK